MDETTNPVSDKILDRASVTGSIEGIVHAAYLLAPHLPVLKGEYAGTAMPGRLFHPDYRSAFRFGAVTLRPGMTLTALKKALCFILDDAQPKPPAT